MWIVTDENDDWWLAQPLVIGNQDYMIDMGQSEIKERVSAFSLITEQLREPSGVALGLASLALTLVSIFVTPAHALPIQWTLAILVVAAAYITLAHKVIRNSHSKHDREVQNLHREIEENRIGLPKVLRAVRDPAANEETILLLEGNRLFGQSMLVSIYFETEESYELLVGNGRVQSSQMNGLLQIVVEAWMDAHNDVRDGVRAGREDFIARLIVRPAPTTQSTIINDVSPETLRLWQWLSATRQDQFDTNISEEDDDR